MNTIHTDAGTPAAERHSLRHRALFDATTRTDYYMTHPVVSDDLLIATAPVKEAFEVIQHLVIHRHPGSPFIGEFRLGKTQTLQIIAAELRAIFPRLGIGHIIAQHHDRPTEKAFFTDTLVDFEHGAAHTGTAADRALRLQQFIEGVVDALEGSQFLFLIDEGQNWGVDEFVWMRDLTNKLKKQGIKCTTIVFGSTELRKLRDALLSTGRKDLIGRFFLKPHTFRGLNSMGELREVMAVFDDGARHEYPAGSGICMSEFFLPMAYEGGWRLAAEAGNLWMELDKVAQSRGRGAKNVGMQWIMMAIRSWLSNAMSDDGPHFNSTPEVWAEAVEDSEYESSLT